MAYNGKSIGEVRAFEEQNVQERPNGADAFFGLLNYKNNQYEKAAAAKKDKIFNNYLTPHFANTMLCAVLPNSYCLKLIFCFSRNSRK